MRCWWLMKEREKQWWCSTHLASRFWDVMADLLCLLRTLLHSEILRLPLCSTGSFSLLAVFQIPPTPGWHQNHFKCDHFDEDSLTIHPHSYIVTNRHLDKDCLTGLRLLLNPLHRLIGGDIDAEFLQIKITWCEKWFFVLSWQNCKLLDQIPWQWWQCSPYCGDPRFPRWIPTAIHTELDQHLYCSWLVGQNGHHGHHGHHGVRTEYLRNEYL